MGYSTLRRGMAALSLVVAVTAGATGPLHAQAAGSGCTSGQWTVMSTPALSGGTARLDAAFAVSSTDVWAGGSRTDTTLPVGHQTSLLEHWDGTQWSVVAGAGHDTSAILSLSGDASNDVWAFGGGPSGVERWDGSRWHAMPSPLPPYGAIVSGTVLAADDVWVYGSLTDPTRPLGPNGYVGHWNGSSWTMSNDVGWGFGSIAAGSDSDVWVASSNEMVHWDGSQWTWSPAGAAGNSSGFLYSVAITPGAGPWAAGYETQGSTDYAELQTWNGTAWAETTIGAASPAGLLSAMSAASGTDAWTVGWAPPPGTSGPTTTVAAHWDGTQWTSVPPLNPGDQGSGFNGVAAVPGQAFAVGEADDETGGHPLIETYCA